MFRKLLLSISVGLILSLSGCGGGGGNDNSEGSGNISSSTIKTIVGIWSYTTQSSGCEEFYVFSDNRREGQIYVGRWAEEALDERQSGHYNIQSTGPDGYLLTMGILSDNGLADCSGESSFDTGSVYYLNVIFKNDNNIMEWSSPGGGRVFILKRRQL